MFCIHCGSKLEPGFRFCMNCGSPVEVPVQPQQPVIPVEEPVWENASAAVEEILPEASVEDTAVVEVANEPVVEQILEEIPAQEPVVEESFTEAPVEEVPAYIPQQPQYAQPVYQQPVYQQPVYQQPYQPVVEKKAKTKPVKKEKPQAPNRGYGKRRGFFLGLLAWILCIAIFFVSMVPIALVSLRIMTSEQGIRAIMDNMDLDELDAASFVSNVEPGKMTALEYFTHEANYRGWDISVDDMEDLMEESGVKNFFAELVSGIVGNVYSGKDQYKLTARDVSKLIKDNADLIYDFTGERLTNSQCNEMAELIMEDVDLESVSVKVLEEELGDTYKIVRFCLSWWMVGILAFVVFLLALLLWLVERRSIIRIARDLCIVYLVLGILLVLACLIPQVLPAVWEDIPSEFSLALTVSQPVLEVQLFVALGVVALGLSQLLLYIISKVCYRCRYAKPASGK